MRGNKHITNVVNLDRWNPVHAHVEEAISKETGEVVDQKVEVQTDDTTKTKLCSTNCKTAVSSKNSANLLRVKFKTTCG